MQKDPRSGAQRCWITVLWRSAPRSWKPTGAWWRPRFWKVLSPGIPSLPDDGHFQVVRLRCTFRTRRPVRIKENLLEFCWRSSINSQLFRGNFRKYPATVPEITMTSTNGTRAARRDRPGAVSAASVVAFSGSTVGGIPGNSVAFLKFGSKTDSRHFDQEVRGAPALRG